MPVQLQGPRLEPASGDKPSQLVILLHGYGADGNDLIGLGREWAAVLPNAAFVSPDATEAMPVQYPGGRQWFALETHSDEELEEGLARTQPVLASFIADEADRLGLDYGSIALVGFSQGTMMALYTGLRLPKPVAAIVGFSGYLAGADRLPADIKSKPPVFLVHGTADPVIPVQALDRARIALAGAGVAVEWLPRPGLGHGIDAEGLTAAGAFLAGAFAKQATA